MQSTGFTVLTCLCAHLVADKFECESDATIILSREVISNSDLMLLVSAQRVTVGNGIDEIATPFSL